MAKSRSEYVIKNATTTVGMHLARNIIAFIGRKVFIVALGAEYLGVNSLYTQILTVLSFAELGIGNAMVFSLYKPLAEKNQEKIKSLMQLYALAYRIIGIIIAVAGICVIPFLGMVVKDAPDIKENLALLYVLFLANTVVSYFFTYKKSLIIADQKNYVVSLYTELFYSLQIIFQSVFLVITKNIIVYLLIMICCTAVTNVYLAHKANKMYPCLKEKNIEPLPKDEKKSIFSNVKALIVYKVGGILLDSTDSIFISILVNIVTVGFYANYKMFVDVFRTIGAQVMNSITASIGNLNTENDNTKKEHVFKDMFYISAWFYGFTAVGLGFFLTAAVEIFFGAEYTISIVAVWAAAIYYYIQNMHYPCFSFRTTGGLFVYGKFVPMICAVINIILDIVMGYYFGLAGIIFASVIARFVTFELIDPIIIYKRIFYRSPITYFARYGLYVLIAAACAGLSYAAIYFIPLSGLFGVIVKAIIFAVVFNLGFFCLTFKTKEFKDLKKRVTYMIKSKRGNA